MTSSTDPAKAGFIKRFWRGEVRLVIAFCLFGIGVPLALEVLHTLLFGAEAETAATPAASRRLFFSCWRWFIRWWSRSASCAVPSSTSSPRPVALKRALGYAAMIWAILVLVRFGAAALILIFVGGLL